MIKLNEEPKPEPKVEEPKVEIVPPTDPPKRKPDTGVIIAAILVLLCGVALAIYMNNRNKSKE